MRMSHKKTEQGGMARRMPPLVVSVVLLLSGTGCGGYWPVRKPSSALWSAAVRPPAPIRWPTAVPGESEIRLEQEGVAVSAELPDAARTKALFHAALLSHDIQPLLLTIRNDSDHPYLVRKASLVARRIPARDAARWACQPLVISVIEHLRWAAFFLPGLLFETIIEPTTTLDFPGMEEAASRPAASNRRQVVEEFVAHEFPDGAIAPGSAQSGVVFIRPPRLGQPLPLTLTDAASQQPVVIALPMPGPVYAETHRYPQPYDVVWGTVLTEARRVHGWRMLGSDAGRGLITIRKGVSLWVWGTSTPVTVTVQRLDDARTGVTVEHPLRATTTAGLGVHSLTIDRFFGELDARLLPPKLDATAPATAQAPVQAGGASPDAGEMSQP